MWVMQENFNNKPEFISPTEIRAMVMRAGEVNTSHSLDMSTFIDAYGLTKVQADYAKVADRMSSHLEHKMSDPEKLGHIFEAAFLDLASRHNWFGEHSEVKKASKFDDIMNGIDMVTTVLDTTNTVRQFEVASDLTISHNGVAEKFNKVANGVRQGKLATINYYHSDLLGYTGRLTDVPKTVVALDQHNMQRFLRNWLNEPELAQEQFSKVMLQQIAIQADGFAQLAKDIHGSDSRVYRRYMGTHQVSQDLLETGDTYDPPPDKSADTIAALSRNLQP